MSFLSVTYGRQVAIRDKQEKQFSFYSTEYQWFILRYVFCIYQWLPDRNEAPFTICYLASAVVIIFCRN